MNRKLGLLFTIVMVASLVLGACAQPTAQTVVQTVEVVKTVEVPVVETVEVEKTVVSTVEVPVEAQKETTLAIEHFSVIQGTTWSGAQDRAAKRLVEKYPSLKYVFRENVTPDQSVPFAEEMIAQGANIVVGNAEHIALPLKDIVEKYPDTVFMGVVASDVSSAPNFIRYFPRQYQALYLEGLIAGALTQTGHIGIVSAFPNVQVIRRTAGFYLGVMDAAKLLNKDIQVHVKYASSWYDPPTESEIANTLVDQYKVDVITQQTDSGSPLDVATSKGIWFVGKDMDIVGEYGWSNTDTVAVSFDTRWEVLFEKVLKSYWAGEKNPQEVIYLGMKDKMTLADGTEEYTVDLMNDGKVGVDAISPKALPLIPKEIVDLVTQRRSQMIDGVWDPFFEHAFVSNGTGLELEGLPIPAKGTEVKPAGQMPTDEWLLSKFNFDLEGLDVLQ
jgi:basic membrane protein A and related proteins